MSKTSLGMGSGLESASDPSDRANLRPEGGAPPGETIYDTIVYVIYCKEHDKIALTHTVRQNKLKAVWMPFVALSATNTWARSVEEGIRVVLNKEDTEIEAKMNKQINISANDMKRLQLFRSLNFISNSFMTRLTYFVKLEKTSDYKCCENNKRLHWYPLKDAISGKIDRLWSPEVKMFANICREPKSFKIEDFGKNYFLDLVPEPKQKKLSEEQDFIKSVGITGKEAEIIINDYMEHCFPSITMSFHSFKDYLTKYGYECDQRNFEMLFNCLDDTHCGYIRFSQLLIGLAVIDPTAANIDIRVKFVFKYYDYDNDGYLNQSELKRLIEDISPNGKEDANKKTQEILKTFNGSNNRLTFDEFFKGVSALKLKGTSKLIRSQKSILKSITKSMSSHESLRLVNQKEVTKLTKTKGKAKGPCPQCRIKKYELAQHSVVLDTFGRSVDSRQLTEPGDICYNLEKPSPSRVYSTEITFNHSLSATGVMDLIRGFNLKKNKLKEEKGLLSDNETERESFMEYLKKICMNLEQIFTNEEKLLRINSPAYVIGDIFGNLTDLMAMETILWQSFPVISANYVFLGNYVDFGKWSVECVLYLFSLKVLSPHKIFLLRGRHEVRDIQIQNTFQKECNKKYGDSFGPQIWQLINKMFDRMPVALIVDESIFCAHSGIPQKMPDPTQFNIKIKNQLNNPSVDSPTVWQLLTNELSVQPLNTKTGFSESAGIGSRSVFDESAVKEFLKQNNYSHIICGNRVTPTGYGFYCGSKFITIFSNSQFKNANNKSAVILLSNRKIRVIRLEISEDVTAESDTSSVASKSSMLF